MVISHITKYLMKFDTFWKIEGLGQSPGRPPPHPARSWSCLVPFNS